MKIIKKGKKYPLVYHGECDECGTVVEFNKREVKTVDDRGEVYHTAKCPVCKEYMYVELQINIK